MRTIEVLGTGCAKCRATVDAIRSAADARGVEIDLRKVERLEDIIAHGVLVTPAVVVDGKVVLSGRVPSAKDVEKWLA